MCSSTRRRVADLPLGVVGNGYSPVMDVSELLEGYGPTYAEAAGIPLRDKPAPLFQLLMLALLSSVPIKAEVAVAAARELFAAGWRTPQRLLGSTWQQRVDALGRASYKRYDESTATALAETAERLLEEYGGDLRRLKPDGRDTGELEKALTGFTRIGPTGATIFCREVQAVWPQVRPYIDARARAAAHSLGLPQNLDDLAATVPEERIAPLAAALTRYSLRH
jgi:hypothetical protein